MSSVRFYAADLAAYNNGILHGAWVDASSDVEEMQEAVQAMLKASPLGAEAEEWAVHDYDDDFKAINHLGEYPGLNKIAEVMEAVEEIEDDYDDSIIPLLLDWVRERVVEPHAWASHLSDAFQGVHDDAEDYAAETTDDTGVPEHLKQYIDYKEMARDMAIGEMDFICTATGDYLQDYDSMRGRECIALLVS